MNRDLASEQAIITSGVNPVTSITMPLMNEQSEHRRSHFERSKENLEGPRSRQASNQTNNKIRRTNPKCFTKPGRVLRVPTAL